MVNGSLAYVIASAQLEAAVVQPLDAGDGAPLLRVRRSDLIRDPTVLERAERQLAREPTSMAYARHLQCLTARR